MTLRFHHVVAVWGAAFTDFFLRYSLPSQLSPGNIPAMTPTAGSAYIIHTTEADAARMAVSPVLDVLRRHVEVRFRTVAPSREELLRSANRYEALAAMHEEAITEAANADAHLILWGPDALMADGACRALERRALEGYDAVLVVGVRTDMTVMRAWMDGMPRQNGGLTLPARDLVRLSLGQPHPVTAAAMASEACFPNHWPALLIWPDDDRLALAYAWHQHPLMIRPSAEFRSVELSVDGDLVDKIMARGRVYVCRDSDELHVVEVSAPQHSADLVAELGPFDPVRFANWAGAVLLPAHLDLFTQPARFVAEDSDPAVEARLRAKSAPLVTRLLEIARPHVRPLYPLRAMSTLQRGGALHLYGSSTGGRKVLDRLTAAGITVHGFIDSEKSGEVAGLPVIPLAQYAAQRRLGDHILVTSQYRTEIAARLRACGILDAHDGVPFIDGPLPEARPVLDLQFSDWQLPPALSEEARS